MGNCQVKLTSDPVFFKKKVFHFYLQNEAENCVPIGIIEELATSDNSRWKEYYLGWVEKNGEVAGCFSMTPPYPVFLTRMPEEAFSIIAEEFQRFSHPINGVLGEKSIVDLFVDMWCSLKGIGIRKEMGQGIFQSSNVIFPPRSAGACVLANAKNKPILMHFLNRFIEDCGLDSGLEDLDERCQRLIDAKVAYFWELDGEPVALTVAQGETPNGIRIGYVYTPEQHRGKGFASNLVAAVSQKMLDAGRKFCFLYTDLANPTSNSIYKKIGYERIATSRHVTFASPS